MWGRIRDAARCGAAYSTDYKQRRACRIGFHVVDPLPPGKFKVAWAKLYHNSWNGKTVLRASIWYGIDTKPLKFNWALEDRDLFF